MSTLLQPRCTLPPDEPFLKAQLDVQKDWGVTDAAILQLVRLEGAHYLGELKTRRDHFSPAIIKLLLDPVEE